MMTILAISPIILRPLMPIGVILLTALIMSIMIVTIMRRTYQTARWRSALRLVLLSLIVFILLNPTSPETGRDVASSPELVVMIDRSASMAEQINEASDDPQLPWPHPADAWFSDRVIDRLSAAADVHWFAFDESTQPIHPRVLKRERAVGRATHLFDALRNVMIDHSSNIPLNILLISDGHDTQTHYATDDELSAVTSLARACDARVHVVPIAGRVVPPQCSISATLRPSRVFDGEPLTIDVLLDRFANSMTEPTVVELLEDSTAVESVYLPPTSGEATRSITFTRQASLPDTTVSNSQAHFTIKVRHPSGAPVHPPVDLFADVLRGPIRVLLLEGQPHWSSRSFAEALRADPHIALTTFTAVNPDRTIITRPDRRTGNGEDPTDNTNTSHAINWRDYEVIALGRAVDRLVDADTLDRLINPTGTSNSPAAIVRLRPDLSATAEDRTSLARPYSDRGADHPIRTYRDGHGIVVGVIDPDDEAESLRYAWRGTESTYQRTARWVDPHLWRVALHASRHPHRAAVYRSLVRQCVHWAAAGDDAIASMPLRITADPVNAQLDEPVAIRVYGRFDAAQKLIERNVRLQLIDPVGVSRNLPLSLDSTQPNSVSAMFTPDIQGIYTVSLPTDSLDGDAPPPVRFAARDRSPEHIDPSARPALLHQLAAHTGGTILQGADVDALLGAIRSQPSDKNAVQVRINEFHPAWPTVALFVVMMILWSVLWITSLWSRRA